jgi:hypothetical protein
MHLDNPSITVEKRGEEINFLSQIPEVVVDLLTILRYDRCATTEITEGITEGNVKVEREIPAGRVFFHTAYFAAVIICTKVGAKNWRRRIARVTRPAHTVLLDQVDQGIRHCSLPHLIRI